MNRPDEAAARAAVVAEALSWLATPYAHRQRLKGVGVDCAQFPLAVYAACAVIPPTDVGPYAPQWHLHRGEELYVSWVLRFAREIAPDAARPGDLLPGDFVLWRYGRTFSHGAIVLDPPQVIHAVRGLGVTLDDPTRNEDLRTRPARAFSLWESNGTRLDTCTRDCTYNPG